LGNIGGGRGRHDDIEEKAKIFLFHLCIVDLSTIIGFMDKLNRTSKAQFSGRNTVICQVHLSGNYILMVILPPNHISLPSTVAIFLATCLVVAMQPSVYFVFHDGDTSIRLGLPWQSYSC